MSIRKTALPTPRQIKFQNWEMGLFIHYLIGVFKEGNARYKAETEKLSPEIFNPVGLDCDQWLQAAVSAKMKYAVLTTKHHDGFCLWPSQVTPDFSVAATPWKNGQGDIVRDFTDACKRYGIAVGLYYSPFDNHCPFYNDDKKYDDYMITHLQELLGNYGQVDLLWFDGYMSEGHVFDWERMVREIRKLQPEILIFNMGDPDFRWVGNESGIADMPQWNTVDTVKVSMASEENESVGQRWLPAECDARLRYEGWTWIGEDDPLKSVEELMGLYYYSVGRGCNLLLNAGPDQRGLIHETDIRRMAEFGAEIDRRFSNPLNTREQLVQQGQIWHWQPQEVELVDHAVIAENIAKGEKIRRFQIKAYTAPEAKAPVTLYEGSSVGHKAICRFPLIKVNSIYLEVLEKDGDIDLKELTFYKSVRD